MLDKGPLPPGFKRLRNVTLIFITVVYGIFAVGLPVIYIMWLIGCLEIVTGKVVKSGKYILENPPDWGIVFLLAFPLVLMLFFRAIEDILEHPPLIKQGVDTGKERTNRQEGD